LDDLAFILKVGFTNFLILVVFYRYEKYSIILQK